MGKHFQHVVIPLSFILNKILISDLYNFVFLSKIITIIEGPDEAI